MYMIFTPKEYGANYERRAFIGNVYDFYSQRIWC